MKKVQLFLAKPEILNKPSKSTTNYRKHSNYCFVWFLSTHNPLTLSEMGLW